MCYQENHNCKLPDILPLVEKKNNKLNMILMIVESINVTGSDKETLKREYRTRTRTPHTE